MTVALIEPVAEPQPAAEEVAETERPPPGFNTTEVDVPQLLGSVTVIV